MKKNRSKPLRTTSVSSFLSIFLLLFPIAVNAAWFDRLPYSVTQPDGTVIECFTSGDEFFNWLHDKDGYTIIVGKDGFYYYGQNIGDLVVPTSYRVNSDDPRVVGIEPWALISEKEYHQRRGEFWSGVDKSVKAPNTGKLNSLTVFIRFADQSEFTQTREFYDNRFNNLSGVSMRNYFLEVSYEQLDIESHHFPICEPNANFSYQDEHPRNYYMPFHAVNNPNGYEDFTQRRIREHTLLMNAINHIAPEVPEGLIIDGDNDDFVDNVCFIIRGNSGAWSDLLWAHRWVLSSFNVFIHGKQVWDYTFQPENQNDVYTLCHEMYHVIGAPDLYHYNSTGMTPIGPWDLMANGFVHMGAYMKFKYANQNWITEITEITQSGTYSLNPITSSENNAFRVASPNSLSEYFVVEYRRSTGLYENNLPGSGLLVYRINTAAGNGNAQGPPDEVYIYRPNGTPNNNGTIGQAHFSANVNRTAISDNTNPSSFLQDGSQGGLNIFNISEAEGSISFEIVLQSQPCPGFPTITYQGQTYNTLKIGNHCWMKENLNVGVMLQSNQSSINNGVIEKYCYNNDPANCQTYGGLYTWDEMMQYSSQEGAQGICPNGWHIPTDEEWKILAGQIDSQYPVGHPVWDNTGWRGSDAGGKMKSTGTSLWQAPNTGANNESGFTGLPGGTCNTGGFFSGINNYAYFWSSTQPNNFSGMYHRLDYNDSRLYRTTRLKGFRLSVRCVKALTSNISGTISDFDNGNVVSNALIVLTGFNNSFTTNSLANGTYNIAGVPTGNYNLSVMKAGYQSYNQGVFITGEPEQTINISLIPGGSNFVEINNILTAYADNIVENPPNVFTLSGNVNINNIMFFDNDIIVDKRPILADPEVRGNCRFYTTNVGSHSIYWIKKNNKDFKYIASENRLRPRSNNYLIDGSYVIGGFPVTIGELIIDTDGDYIEVKSIAQMPFPVNRILEDLVDKLDILLVVESMAGSKILSRQNGEQTVVNISGVNANLKVFKIEDFYLYFDTSTETYGGGFMIEIPGISKSKLMVKDSLEILDELSRTAFDFRDENNEIIDSLSIYNLMDMRYNRSSYLVKFGASIEFVQGDINKITVSVGTKVPIGTTGLFITKVTGGMTDLAKEVSKITAGVDIELFPKVPVLGSPVKLNDFTVDIQPWSEFGGRGEFQVFEQTVSNGSIEYSHSKRSLEAKGRIILAPNFEVLTGGFDLNLSGNGISGSGIMTIQTPSNLPKGLGWASNKRLGQREVYFSNELIQYQTSGFALPLALEIKLGKVGIPYFHFSLGLNLNNLIQVWKGHVDHKTAITFQVPENTQQLLVVAKDTINSTETFDFVLQSPTGQIFNQDNVYYYDKDEASQSTIMSLLQPIEGDWVFLTEFDGDFALFVSGLDQTPATMIEQPNNQRTRSKEISLTINDFADTLKVQVFYNTQNRRFDGSFIDEFTVINNAELSFTWQNQDLPNGEYFIYARIDDGKNTPVFQYAPGSIWVENDPNIETPENLGAVQQGDSIIVSWSKAQMPNTLATNVYYKDLSTRRTEQKAVGSDNQTVLHNLTPGRGYEIWCRFINDNGTYSPKSNVVILEFTSSNRNNPPYFTMDRDSIFVFIAGENSQYTLQASDADGDLLTFSIPGDTLGINITGNQFSWLPDIEQRGVYQVKFVVSDGSETDTTNLQFVVYTPEQVETRLAFNSVRLYEADNTFIILRNFFSEQPTEIVTLTNMRTMEQAIVECRRVNKFEYMGQFFLSFLNRSEITVAEGDSIRASYTWNDETHYAYAYYDSNPQPTDVTPPGIISDLTAERLENNRVKLKWTATGNDGNIGKAFRYDIRYAYEPIESEGVYFTAHRILNFPYPSMSGEQDSLIINLANLVDITLHENIYFSIKAEDEMQNRGGLSNSPGVPCLINPSDVTAGIADVYKIQIQWNGPIPDASKEGGVQHYNLFRKFNQGSLSIYQTGITALEFTDNLKILPDGNYLYAVQAIYDAGVSDTIFAPEVLLQRFVNVNVLCQLEDTMNFSGITFNMTALDTIYAHNFTRTTNPTGLILLNNVFKSDYSIEIFKEGYESIIDTITVSDSQKSFSFMLTDTVRKHPFSLPAGWSGISSHIKPYDEDVETLFSPILSDLIILQSETGMYWPGENVNTIGNWNTLEGYKIKVANAVELTITGSRETNKTLQLSAGWNLIPVLSECAVDVEALFAGKDLVIVKEVAGWNLYWPAMGINTLGGLQPGRAYFVLMGSLGDIEFPECDGLKKVVIPTLTGFETLSGLTPWPLTPPTAATHAVALPVSVAGELLHAGDIIGVFDQDGNCSGLGIWQGDNTAITLFGSDPTTKVKDGFTEGEHLEFRLYRPYSNEGFDLEVAFDKTMPNPDPIFNMHGISAIKELDVKPSKVGATGSLPKVSIIPNPASDEILITIVDKDFDKGVLDIFAIDGRLVKMILLTSKSTSVIISDLQAGVYVLQVGVDGQIVREKLIKK